MESQEITYHARLITSSCDGMGYTTYVFENLEYRDYDYKYIMCVRFPNWNQNPFKNDDVGFLTVRYVRAGIDKWFDGEEFIPYKYTNIVFLKFIEEKIQTQITDIITD